jgi:DNA-binding NtrC family response regulator
MFRAKSTVLIVDDEPAQRQLLSAILDGQYAVTTASDVSEAKRLLEGRSFDIVVTDECMPGDSGLELISWAREHAPEIPIIVLTAYGSIQTAVESMKLGAQDYLIKPLKEPEELRLAVARTISEQRLKIQNLVHRAESEIHFPPDIIAESDAMKQVLRYAEKVAPQPTTVLLSGESGTGKEVVARFIHRRSPRSDGPFVAINCAALTDTLLESELFGHERGAFTGAIQSKRGLFELAHGGTLFLDEIGEMSISLQAKLLRALQEQRFERVGGTRSISVDVRVVAASNRDLEKAIDEKTFRDDLYYRLNVFPIHLPPLKERREDIMPLALHFMSKISARIGRAPRPFSQEARRLFLSYGWPGNVRELQNAIERALIVSQSQAIQPEDLPLQFSGDTGQAFQPVTLSEIERAAILDSLSLNQGNRHETAEQLGISLRTLQYRLKEYGITGRD